MSDAELQALVEGEDLLLGLLVMLLLLEKEEVPEEVRQMVALPLTLDVEL